MNSSKMRNASLYAVSILVSLLTLGLVGATGAAVTYGASGSVLEVLPSPLANPVSPLADDWSLLGSAGVLNVPETQREFRVALLGGTGLAGMTAIGQGVWGAAPTLAYPTSPAAYSNDGVDPNNSNAGATNFNFRVVYRDTMAGHVVAAGGSLLHIVDVNLVPIAGSPFVMTSMGGDPTSGETWGRTVLLQPGNTYFFYFFFTNVVAETVRWPASGYVPVGGVSGAGIVVNTTPTLTNAATTATTDTGPQTGATFTVVYTDADNNAPTIRRLEVYTNEALTTAYTGSPFTMTVDPTAAPALRDGNYANGERYIATVNLQEGRTYYWRFRFNDGIAPDVLDPDASAVPNYYGPVTRSQRPTLTSQANNAPNPDAQPQLITQPTQVTFTVVYTDADDDAPANTRLHIHKDDPRVRNASRYTDPMTTLQSPFTMQLDSSAPAALRDGVYTNGERYIYAVFLERPGVYYYYFSFTNSRGTDGTVTSPDGAGPSFPPLPANPYHGPVLITRDPQGIAPASPYDDGSDPSGGTGAMTTVTFRWRYKDLDDEAPTVAQVRIFTNADLDPAHEYGASPYNMTRIAGNYADTQGALYSATVDLPSPGHYFYYFVFDNATYVLEAGHSPNATLWPINLADPILDIFYREPAPNAVPDYRRIMLVNQPAVLSDPSLAPNSGGQWDSDPSTPGDQPYVFNVTYTDPDNSAPADGGVLLKLWRTTPEQYISFLMTVDVSAPAALRDGDYTNGERYTISVFGYNRANPGVNEILDGDHIYYFEANDGLQTTRLPSNAPTPRGPFNGPKINDPPNPVTAGFDPSGGAVLETATPNITWSPASDPNPTDTINTLTYRIEFSQTTGPFVPLAQYQQTTAAGATTGQPRIPLPSGTWYYRIITRDDDGAESVPSAEQSFRVNAAPELSDGSVAPPTSGEGDNFSFTVRYRDIDDDPPASISVLVNRTTAPALGPMAFPMVPKTPPVPGPGDHAAGVIYEAVLTGAQIRDGDHNFYFEAGDGVVTTLTRFPAGTGTIGPPTPIVNDPPNPVTSGFSPAGGAIVNVARPNISWNPATDPNSTDPPSTLRYRVEFSTWDGDWGSPQYSSYTFLTGAGTTSGQPSANLPDGVWYYRIITIDNQTPTGAESVPSAVQQFQVQTTGPYWPVGIVEDDFSPSSGQITGLTPTLSWPQGAHPTDAPGTLRYQVEIYNNATYTAPAVHTSPLLAAGVRIYNVPAGVLGGGTYYWRVIIRDRSGRLSPWTNQSGPGPGLTIDFLVNRAPELAGGQVTPARGGEPDNFTFRVVYTDADDNPPSSINVFVTRTTAPVVGPTPFAMTPESPAVPGPGDYVVGVTYAVTVTGAQIRDADHTCYFEASDGLITTPVRFPSSGGLEGPVVNDPPNAVTSGFNPSGGAVVNQARPHISWNPATDPNSTDVSATLRYRLEFSTTAAPADWGSPLFSSYTVTTAAGVTTAQPGANLPDGVWYYRIITIDNQTPTGAESVPSAVQQFQVATGGPYWPVAIIEDDFSPSNGARTTATPTLSWPQGAHPTDAPATLRYQIEIYSDPGYTTLVHASPLLAAGVRTYAVPTGAITTGGTYYWRVRIRDASARVSVWTNEAPPSPNLQIDFNYTPTLSNGQVLPVSGGVGDDYVFQVTYTDIENRAPVFVNVSCTNVTRGGPAVVQAMSPAGPGPHNYAAGVVFQTTISGSTLRDGRHTFFFQANDGVVTINLYAVPPATPFDGPTVNDPPFAPTSGFNPTGGTMVEDTQPLLQWNAASDPNPSDTPATLRYRVEFSQTATPFVVQPAYTATTAAGVTNVRPSAPLTLGDWYWRVWTIDQFDAVSLAPSAVQYFRVAAGGPYWPATIVEDDFAPSSGIRTTATPTLSWPQGAHSTDAPATLRYQVEIYSDPTYTTLVHASPLLAAGVRTYAVPAGVITNGGTYYWRVRIRDVSARVSAWTNEAPPGPDLQIDFNYTPTLSNGQVIPTSAGVSSNYVFRVTYTDMDNRAPVFVNVSCTNVTRGGPAVVQAMSPAGPGPHNYAAGVVFQTTIPGTTLRDGEHTFFFQASDGAVTINLYAAPPTTQFEGPTVNDPPYAPTDGFSPTGGALVDVPQPLLQWNAGSDPNPADTPATLRYRVEFSQTATPFVVEPLYTATTPPGVTNARPAAPLPATEQDWYWRVWTIDQFDAVSVAPSPVQMFHLNLNHPPACPTPVAGYVPADNSTIRLTTPLLNWPDGTDPDPLDTPATLSYDLQVDNNIDFSSPLIDTTTAPGVSQYQVVPADGLMINVPYYWRVRTRDPQGATSEWSEVALGLTEPLEFMVVMNAYLTNGRLTPLRGGLATNFLFQVDYFDPDDLPPGGPIQVNIGPGVLVADLARDPTDLDAWVDGVTYFGYVNGAALGYGHFQHIFQIAGTTVRDPEVPATYDGPIIGTDSTSMFTDASWVSVDTYEEGSRIYVQVTDTDENENPAVRDTVTVTVTERDGDTETITLNEQGVNTGTFRGSLPSLGRAGDNGDGTLNVRSGSAGNTITATYTDPDGGDVSQDTALVVDTVAPAALAAGQLVVASGPDGTSVVLDWTAYNEAAQIDVAGYNIYQSNSSFGWTTALVPVASVPAGTRTTTVTGLTPNTLYFFAVGSYDEVPNEERRVSSVGIRTRDTNPPYPANQVPAPGAFNVPVNSNITLDVLDDGVGVNLSTVRLMVNGRWVTNQATIQSKGEAAVEITYDPPRDFAFSTNVQVRVVADDDEGNHMDVTYQFSTRTDVTPPQVVNKQFNGAGGWLSFHITDDVSGVKTSTIVVRVRGVDVTGACVIDDSNPLDVLVRYDQPGGWGWNNTVDISVDCADNAGNVMPTETWQEQGPVDTTGPVISSLNPADGEQNAPVTTTVSATLTDNGSGVDMDTVVLTLQQGAVPVPGTYQVVSKGETEVDVIFTPAANLAWNTSYNAHVEGQDDEGNASARDWSFKTQAQPTFDISGNVTDRNGNPLAGVEVSADGQTVTTDGTGTYRIQGLTAGTYTVVPARAGYSFSPASRQVTVGPSQQQVNFVGSELTYRVSGRVTQVGVGVSGVLVTAGGRSAVTDNNGNYTITGLVNGTYSVSCARDADNDGYQDFVYTPTARTVNVTDANVTGVDFTAAPRTYSISGTITDSSGARVPNVTVSDGTRSTVTDTAGRFTLAGVAASTVTVTPTRTGMAFNPASRQVTVPPDATNVNFTAYTAFTHRFPGGLSMVALPLTPPSGQRRLVDIFGTNRVARWDPTANSWVRGDLHSADHAELQARPGAAWFIRLPSAQEITLAGDPVGATGTFSLGLSNGWNMMGNMYQTALSMANINVAGGGQLRPYGFVFDNATGSYRMVTRAPAVNSARTYVEAWEGAWLRAVGATVSVQVTAPVGAADLRAGEAAQAKLPAGGWVVPVVARAAGVADLCTVAGVGEQWQVENPPKLPGTVDVYFTDAAGTRLAQDIRPLGASKLVWDFVVETDLAEARVEVSLPDLSGVPTDQVVYLTDVDAGKTIYARTMPSYSFVTDEDGAQRHFQLVVQPKGADNLVITSASAHCTNAGAVITYSVTRPCQVNVTVLNIAGRPVRSLAVARPASAGSNVQAWDLRSDEGTLAPAGQYLVRIEAVAENGQRVQALRPLHVSR